MAFCIFFAALFVRKSTFSICRLRVPSSARYTLFLHFSELTFFLIIETIVARLLLVAFGTIERNPGPRHLKFAMWNVGSLLTREGSKKSLIEGLDSCHQFDIIGHL